jgi:hypothetical protein
MEKIRLKQYVSLRLKGKHNYGVMSEVGRLPIILDYFKATIGYWHRLENISSGLLKDAYFMS